MLHAGPAKTATKSIQKYLVPSLGRPFQVKPAWTKAVARGREFTPPAPLPAGSIISDENLADFAVLPPTHVAERLARITDGGVVVIVARSPVERFYSLYRQNFINALVGVRAQPTWLDRARLLTINERFELDRRLFTERGIGFFKVEDHDDVETAFRKYFDFVRLPYALLGTDPARFVAQFCKACGAAPLDIPLGAENVGSVERVDALLNAWPCPIAESLKESLRTLYLEPLSARQRGHPGGLGTAAHDHIRLTQHTGVIHWRSVNSPSGKRRSAKWIFHAFR